MSTGTDMTQGNQYVVAANEILKGRRQHTYDHRGHRNDGKPRCVNCGTEQPAPAPVVPSRNDLIQCLLATRGQSEGVAADAILGIFESSPKPAEQEQERTCRWAWIEKHEIWLGSCGAWTTLRPGIGFTCPKHDCGGKIVEGE